MSLYPTEGEFYIYGSIFVSKLGAVGWGRKEQMRLLGHCCHVVCPEIVMRGPQSDQFPAVATQKSEKLNTVG